MLEVTVKTLDSQNHTFSVSEESTVKEFKEQISPVLNISVEKQRLIFCGKVLKDDKKLSEYNVNGKVIHVVQSLPPQGNNASASSTSGSTGTTNTGPRPSHRDAAGFVLGAFTIPQDFLDPNQVQNIVQEVVSGMGELGRNATVISRNTEDGPSVDFRINLGQVPLQSEAQLRMNRVQTMFMRANRLLDFLENGPNTGNNSSESSSQTDNDEEIRNRLMEADIGNVLRGDSNGSSRGSGDSAASIEAQNEPSNTSQSTEESGNPPSAPERYGLEGLAQVAQAALTAAIATATAAARAATSTLSPHSTPSSEANDPTATRADSESTGTTTEANPEIDLTTVAHVAMEVDIADCESGHPSSETTRENQTNSTDNRTADNNSSQNSGHSTEAPESGPAPREPSQPSVQTLANLLDEVIRVNTRLEPCLEKCRDLIRTDAVLTGNDLVDAHRLFSKTSQLLHFLSHAYHSLSDLHINFAARPPRSPRVRIISSPTVIQQAIPVQAQINITSSLISPTSNPSTTTTPNTTTATTNTQNDAPAPQASNRGVPLTRMPEALASSFNNLPRIGSLPRIPSTSSIPAAVRGSQNPMFYMEVTPGSITIDSIAAAVDASLGSLHLPDEEFDASSRDTPTPPANSNANQTENRSESQTSDAQTSTPHTRSFQYMHSGFGPAGTAVRNLIPVPLTSMGGLQTFDSALPCHSVWALEPARRRHHAGQSRASAESQRNPRVSGVNVSARTVPDSTAQGTTNETSQPVSANGTAQSATTHSSASTGTTASGLRSHISSFLRNMGPDFAIPETIPGIPLNLQHRLMEDLASPGFINHILSAVDPMTELGPTIVLPPQRRNGRDNSNSSSSAAPCPCLSVEQYLSSVEELRVSASFPFNTTTLADFFLNNRDIQFQENDIVGPAIYYLCQILTLEDLFEASLENFSTFNRIREPLLVYIFTKLFPIENTEEQNKAVVDKIVTNLMALLEPIIAHLDIRPGIDYRATMTMFFKHKIDILKDKLSSDSLPDAARFGFYICKNINRIVLEFHYLHNCCCDSGLFAFQSVFNQYINQICIGNRAPFRQVLLDLGSLLINREPIAHIYPLMVRSYIVSTTSPELRQRFHTPRRAEASAPSRVRNPEQNEFPRHFRSHLIQQTEELVRLLEQRTRSHRRTLENQSSAPTVEEVVIGSESWHNAVPRDWVPIITRDVQRQRRQAPQPPFGDAYLSGMPSKRRKIMTSGAQTLLENSKTTFSDILQQAIASADVKPLSSPEQVKKEASDNLSLQTAFTLHMKNAIQERLQQDLDYCSEKFPNAKKYYM